MSVDRANQQVVNIPNEGYIGFNGNIGTPWYIGNNSEGGGFEVSKADEPAFLFKNDGVVERDSGGKVVWNTDPVIISSVIGNNYDAATYSVALWQPSADANLTVINKPAGVNFQIVVYVLNNSYNLTVEENSGLIAPTGLTRIVIDYIQDVPYYITDFVNEAYVPTSRTITINGTTYDLSTNRSWIISPGSSQWNDIDDGIYYNSGVVIINNDASVVDDDYKLQVLGKLFTQSDIYTQGGIHAEGSSNFALIQTNGNGSSPFSLNSAQIAVSNYSLNSVNDQQIHFNIYTNVEQSETAGYTALRVSTYEASLGSGTNLLIDLGTNSGGYVPALILLNSLLTDLVIPMVINLARLVLTIILTLLTMAMLTLRFTHMCQLCSLPLFGVQC